MNAKAKFDHSADLVFLPLGGTGEIGMNCYLYGLGAAAKRQWIMVDLGVKFGEDAEPGIDVVLPDVSFIAKNRDRLLGLILTHAHEDHLGAVPWLWPQLRCPVYCTAFAAEILKLKLKEVGLDEEVEITLIEPGRRFTLGGFTLEPVAVTHSIPEPTGLLIETPAARVFHSGDWKIDRTPVLGRPMDEKRLREIGEVGLDALVCDSTNVLREGWSPSEADVAETLIDIVRHAPARVAITTFASHVDRISSAVRAARATGREVVIAGRAMRNTIEAARVTGYLRNAGEFFDEEEAGYLPPAKVLILCTGSQGEPRAAIARIAEDQHPHIALDPGDLVIFSSKTIPGNEKEVARIHNNLAKLDIDIITSDHALVHSSGHPRQDELRTLYQWLRPRLLMPMHGEPRHVRAQAKFARDCGIEETLIPQDGQIIKLAPGTPQVVDEAYAGRLHVDGSLIVPVEEGPARQRRKLSFVGAVFVSLALDTKHNLVGDMQVICDGVPAGLDATLREAAQQAFGSMLRPRRGSDDTLADTLRTAIRRAAEQAWGKKPVVKVAVLRV